MTHRGLFHIYRNTPMGRETLLQSLYFARRVEVPLRLYVPRTMHFLMYFDQAVVQIDLSPSYLNAPETAAGRIKKLVNGNGTHVEMLDPKHFTGPDLPDIAPEFDFMTCPRCISHPPARIGIGMIGPKVRMLLARASFPLLISSPVYKPWHRLAVLLVDSQQGDAVMDVATFLQRRSGMPLDIYRLEGNGHGAPAAAVGDPGRTHVLDATKPWSSTLYDIPHDALLIIGAGNVQGIRERLFGAVFEKVQNVVTNNLMVVGPNVGGAPM